MSRPETDLAAALAADTPIPRDAEGPIFAEPWQAQAFALVVALQNKGVFTADEWAQALGAEIREALAAGGCRDGSDYYERWCEALEHRSCRYPARVVPWVLGTDQHHRTVR